MCVFTDQHSWNGLVNKAHCRHCHATWSGQTACHCTVCHETFASYFSSDLHWVRPAGMKNGEGKHTHPSKVADLVPVVRADGGTYWTKNGVSNGDN